MNDITATFAALGVVAVVQLQITFFFAAVFSGLSGFGFSAIGALALCILEPTLAVPLLMALSIAMQALNMGSLRAEMRASFQGWSASFVPFALGGLFGLPLGLALLTGATAQVLTLLLGAMLVLYGAWHLVRPVASSAPGVPVNLWAVSAVGLLGGVIGGFSASPSLTLVVWTGVKNLPKAQARSLIQPYIMVMQVAGLAMLAATARETFSPAFWSLFLTALPVALLGNRIGIALYKRTAQVNYRRVTLVALVVSGLGLVAKALGE